MKGSAASGMRCVNPAHCTFHFYRKCFLVLQKNLSDIEKTLEDLEPISQTQTKGKRILIQDIEESEGVEEQGENGVEHENGSGDKSNNF